MSKEKRMGAIQIDKNVPYYKVYEKLSKR